MWGMSMITKVAGHNVINCRDAAKLLGVSMGRVRQLARAGTIWSEHVTERALVLDREQVKNLADLRQKARAAGMVPGQRPGGFKADD
jgi:hypothetical protein